MSANLYTNRDLNRIARQARADIRREHPQAIISNGYQLQVSPRPRLLVSFSVIKQSQVVGDFWSVVL